MDFYEIMLQQKLAGGEGGDVSVESLSVTENGTYSASSGHAYNPVTVNVPNTYGASDEGKVVSNGALVGQTSKNITANGTVDTTLNNSVVVDVPSVTPTGNINITSTAQTDVSAYATAQVVDSDLVASNIKKDVNILGVTGTYEGGGGGDTTLKALIEGTGTSFIIPDGVTKLRSYLFRSSEYTDIVIPDSVTEIGGYALAYCLSLKTLTCKATNPPSMGNNVLSNTNNLEAIYVPNNSVNAYKTAGQWQGKASVIQAIPE